MAVPLLEPRRQHLAIGAEIEAALIDVFRSGRYIGGDKITDFENECAQYCGCKFGVGMSSGTDALLAALMALNIGAGDEVITSTFSFFATAGVIVRLGAIPRFCDIDPVTFNISPAEIKRHLNKKTKAIMPVHLYGQCADMDAIMEIAGDIPIVEDCAQAIGAEYKNRRAGSFSKAGCFSFFPSKNLGCLGDGGLVTTNDEQLAHRLRLLRNHGAEPKYYHKIVGGNFRLDAIQAAVLSIKLKKLDTWTAARQKNAQNYNAEFAKHNLNGKIVLPKIAEHINRHIFNQYTLRCQNRDGLLKHLQSKNVGCEVYYPVALHQQECFANLPQEHLPNAEKICNECLSIPIYDQLTNDELPEVVNTVVEFYR